MVYTKVNNNVNIEEGPRPGTPPLFRIYRAKKNALGIYTDAELVRRYRLDHTGMQFMTDLGSRDLQNPIAKKESLITEMKVVMTLRGMARSCVCGH